MPFKSQAQRRFMYARHPEIAKRWSSEYGSQPNLPEKAGSSEGRARAMRRLAGRKRAYG